VAANALIDIADTNNLADFANSLRVIANVSMAAAMLSMAAKTTILLNF